MLARMVSICRPRDLPSLASQSAEITGVSHYARPTCVLLIGLVLFSRFFAALSVYWFQFLCPQSWTRSTCRVVERIKQDDTYQVPLPGELKPLEWMGNWESSRSHEQIIQAGLDIGYKSKTLSTVRDERFAHCHFTEGNEECQEIGTSEGNVQLGSPGSLQAREWSRQGTEAYSPDLKKANLTGGSASSSKYSPRLMRIRATT
ncbi:hypothetical protein AAY473_033088 [Plecturocebus cupreus]